MKKRSVVMYNMIFPIWLILTPLLWPPLAFMVGPFALLIIFVMIFGNLGVDWLVVCLAMHWQKVENAKEKAAAVLCRVCLCGFAADTIAGLALMFAPRLFQIVIGFTRMLKDLLFTATCLKAFGQFCMCRREF